MKKKLFFFLMCATVYAQDPNVTPPKTLPYAIILVHGLNGNDGEWVNNLIYLKSIGIRVDIDSSRYEKGGAGNGSRLDYCLNYDNDPQKSILNRKGDNEGYFGDVKEYPNQINGKNDVFVVNFDNQNFESSESSIVKQAFAIGLAVKKVILSTKVQKVVLVGHGIAGLAIREYLTNPEDWQLGQTHHVAHIVTIGTPHGGVDNKINFFKNEYSEAVRDMSAFYLNTDTNGIFLFGGIESSIKNLKFVNTDFNCNGANSDLISGLNNKIPPPEVSITCVIGDINNTGNDGIFSVESQNISNYIKTNDRFDFFKLNAKHSNIVSNTNFKEVELNYTLDIYSAIHKVTAYNQLELQVNNRISGIFVNRFSIDEYPEKRQFNDSENYYIKVISGGKLNITTYTPFGLKDVKLFDKVRSVLIIPNKINNFYGASEREYILKDSSIYEVSFTSNSFSKGVQHYVIQTEFCQYPPFPKIVSENGKTTLCQGETTYLEVENNFENYNWVRNGNNWKTGGNKIKIDSSGIYSLIADACGGNFKSNNTIQININQNPTKPTILIENGLKSSSEKGNQWFLNGKPLKDSTNQILKNWDAGVYMVRVIENGCFTDSDVFAITANEFNKELQIKLFPNPNEGKFWFEVPPFLENFNLDIYNIEGKHILSKFINNREGSEFVNFPFPAGYYYLILSNQKYKFGVKFIKN